MGNMDHTILYDDCVRSDRDMEVIYNSNRGMVRVVIHHTNSMGNEQSGRLISPFFLSHKNSFL